jgi:hypothetical protein
VIQGTLTSGPEKCITFNLTRCIDSNELILNQLPQNAPSRLSVLDDKNPSKMRIHWSDTYIADFSVLVTDYGESRSPHGAQNFFSRFIAISRQLCGIFHLQERVEAKVFKSCSGFVEDKESHRRSP